MAGWGFFFVWLLEGPVDLREEIRKCLKDKATSRSTWLKLLGVCVCVLMWLCAYLRERGRWRGRKASTPQHPRSWHSWAGRVELASHWAYTSPPLRSTHRESHHQYNHQSTATQIHAYTITLTYTVTHTHKHAGAYRHSPSCSSGVSVRVDTHTHSCPVCSHSCAHSSRC